MYIYLYFVFLSLEKVVGRVFEITDYGVCYLDDILSEVPENTIIMDGTGCDLVISLPRRGELRCNSGVIELKWRDGVLLRAEQTIDELERAKQFALEVVDLLKNSPQCLMPFNKFIPAYHHHFGKQCRVSDYGFSKLLELFESIPSVVEVRKTSYR